MPKKLTSDADFVTAWVTSKTVDEVVKKTGLAKMTIQVRAARLRKAGVKLPKFVRRKTIDVDGLNALVGKLLKKSK